MVTGFLAEHRDAVLSLAGKRLRNQHPASSRVQALRDTNLPVLFDSVAAAVRGHEDEGSNSPPRVARGAHIAGQQVSFDIDELVFQYETLCHSVNEHAKQLGATIPLDDQQSLNTALDGCIARTVIEWEQEKRRSAGADEVQRLGYVAHEMRNALRTATVSFQAIRSGRVPLHGALSDLLERSHERLRNLVQTLVVEVRLDAGLKAEQARMNVAVLLQECLAFVSAHAEQNEIEISVAADPALEIEGDRDLLVSVFTNLLQNAIKFGRRGGSVSVRAHNTSEGRVVVEIEDECGGLAADTARKLFAPFVQSGHERNWLGLGLAVAQQVVDAHGGTIQVRNLPGKGCVFAVDLPPPERH